jgi:hypothetical protein
MDYAISEVFRQLPPEIKEFLLIYDISCQWVIHWIERFMQGKHLLYREDLKLFAAVGKFHLGAHVLECLILSIFVVAMSMVAHPDGAVWVLAKTSEKPKRGKSLAKSPAGNRSPNRRSKRLVEGRMIPAGVPHTTSAYTFHFTRPTSVSNLFDVSK